MKWQGKTMKPYKYLEEVKIIGFEYTKKYFERVTGKPMKKESIQHRKAAIGKPTKIMVHRAASFPLMVGVCDPNDSGRDLYVHPWDLSPRKRAMRSNEKIADLEPGLWSVS